VRTVFTPVAFSFVPLPSIFGLSWTAIGYISKVTTAEQLCEKYNQKLQGEYDKWQETQRQMAQDVLDNKIAPQVALEVAKKMPKLEFAPEKLSKAWAFRFRKAFGWVKRVTNTQGVYLPYEHPKMQAARADFERDLSAGIDRRLYLNVDQVWRSAYSGGKYAFRKDWCAATFSIYIKYI